MEPLLLQKFPSVRIQEQEWSWTQLCARMHIHWTKKLAREDKNLSDTGERGGKRRCVNRKEGSQTGSSNWKCSSTLPLSLSPPLSRSFSHSLSLGLCLSLFLWHLCRVGPALSMHSSCVCLSTRPPPPCWHRQREARKKRRWGQGLPHKTKVAPIEAKPPHTLQIFTPYTHIHTAPFLHLFVWFLSLHLI